MNVCIVGLGLIGGTYAHALQGHVNEIYAIDVDEKAILTGKKMGLIVEGDIKGDKLLPKADIVIICLYPKLIKKFLLENKDNFKDGAIITDATGIKGALIDKITDSIPKNIDFIFGHPMAGREKIGVENAHKDIFSGANYILTLRDENKIENVKILRYLIYKMGFKNVNSLSPQAHDEIISFTSQLTHAIAVALINSDNQKYDTNLFIGDSYRDLTRIAKINSKLWTELFMENKENLIGKIDDFQKKLTELKVALISEDAEILSREFRESTKRRESID